MLMRSRNKRPRRFVNATPGIGIGFGGARAAWTPASLPNLAAWYEARDEAAILVPCTQPTYVDGGCDDHTLWGTGGDAVLSNPGTGMRVASAAGNGYASQTSVFVALNRMGYSFRARGDGIKYARAIIGNIGVESTSSTTWQTFTGDHTAGNANLLLQTKGSGGYSEFDSIVIENLSRSRWNPTAGSLGGYLSQATAASQLWWDETYGGLRGDGVADYVESSLAASAWTQHKAAGYAVSMIVRFGSTGGGTLIATAASSTHEGIYHYHDSANQKVTVAVANGAAWILALSTPNGSCTKDALHVVTVSWSGSAGGRILVDGNAAVTGATSGTPGTGDATISARFGRATSNYLDGAFRDIVIAGHLSDTELDTLHAYMRAKAGV